MATKSDLADPTLIEGWLRDMNLAPVRKSDSVNAWNVEFTIAAGNSPLVIGIVNPRALPRAIMFVCGLAAAPEHIVAFSNLDEDLRKEFWNQLRSTLNREFVEYQIEGTIGIECPKTVRLTAVRFDDGLTLDSFARTLSSVCKAAADAATYFTDRLGNARRPAPQGLAS
jgi:hypothetical protein